jgi:hypothetical protein
MLRVVIKKNYGFDPGTQSTADPAVQLCLANPFNPVVDYLDGIEWDGKPRLDNGLCIIGSRRYRARLVEAGRQCSGAPIRRHSSLRQGCRASPLGVPPCAKPTTARRIVTAQKLINSNPGHVALWPIASLEGDATTQLLSERQLGGSSEEVPLGCPQNSVAAPGPDRKNVYLPRLLGTSHWTSGKGILDRLSLPALQRERLRQQ